MVSILNIHSSSPLSTREALSCLRVELATVVGMRHAAVSDSDAVRLA